MAMVYCRVESAVDQDQRVLRSVDHAIFAATENTSPDVLRVVYVHGLNERMVRIVNTDWQL